MTQVDSCASAEKALHSRWKDLRQRYLENCSGMLTGSEVKRLSLYFQARVEIHHRIRPDIRYGTEKTPQGGIALSAASKAQFELIGTATERVLIDLVIHGTRGLEISIDWLDRSGLSQRTLTAPANFSSAQSKINKMVDLLRIDRSS